MNNIDKISKQISSVLTELGEDVRRPGLLKTPERAALALSFLTAGHKKEKEVVEDCRKAIFDEGVKSMIAIKNIEFFSMCEHHMLPFWGNVSISFLPNKNGKILGLSKFGRLVDVFSRRLQVQENLTEQLLEVIEKLLKPQALCIRIEAQHMCMMMRGVEKHSSSTVTYTFQGKKQLELGLKDLLK